MNRNDFSMALAIARRWSVIKSHLVDQWWANIRCSGLASHLRRGPHAWLVSGPDGWVRSTATPLSSIVRRLD